MSDYPKIVPKGEAEARGVDFCGTKDYYYIIRSDLGVYMRSTNFNEGNDIKIYTISEACRWGDHYLAGEFGDDSFYYIIKGNEYRKVTNMNKDDDAVVYSLHPNCRGGSFYYCAFGSYYIMFPDKGFYRRVSNMNTDEDAVEFSINEAFKDGIYFWGLEDYVYCLKQADRWGVSYHRSTNMNKDLDPNNWSMHPSVINFLPGGIAQTKGKAFCSWEKLKSFTNESSTAVDWERTITETVGFEESKMSSIEHNWSIEGEATYSTGFLTESICKYQFSLSVKYGGQSVNTHLQNWSNATEQLETLKMHIEPHSEVYIWQYQMGFGDETSLFCTDVEITKNPNPPTDPPQRLAQV